MTECEHFFIEDLERDMYCKNCDIRYYVLQERKRWEQW